jgi:3-oxoacyl-[acyl-carrier protein] reductase
MASRRVLVTGGSGGLGRAICRELAGRGLTVAIGYHRNRGFAEGLAAELQAEGRDVRAVRLDVVDAAGLAETVGRLAGDWGGLDGLVNGAAVNVDGLLPDLSPDDIGRMCAVNVAGTLYAIRATLPHLLAAGGGRIVNFSSMLASRTIPGTSGYVATKGAIESLTRALAVEWGAKDILINAVAPGFIDAGLGKAPIAAAGSLLRTLVPLRRAGSAEEVARVVAFLLSEEADYVNGAVVPVDGGLMAGARSIAVGAAAMPQEVSHRE